MRAVTYAQYGSPDVLTLVDLPDPTPGPGQVLIAVQAWGVNPFDHKVRSGAFAGDKPFGNPKKVGRDLAGQIVAVGEGVKLPVGARVVASVAGASAELVPAKESAVVVLPAEVTFEAAAAIPGAGMAALRALQLSGVQPGQTLLVHAAAGGVGTFLVQLAKAAGITVIGTAGERNQEYLRGLGVLPVVYGDGWADRVRAVQPAPIDAVIDGAGRGVALASVPLLAPGGKIITLVDFGAEHEAITATDGSEPGFENALADAVAAVADGRVTIEIDSTYPLAGYADAHRASESGHARGKIVLTP